MSVMFLCSVVCIGNMPPIVTVPTVIRCKVNSTVNMQIVAQDANRDPVSFSLLFPRPPQASIGTGETHTHIHKRVHSSPRSLAPLPLALCPPYILTQRGRPSLHR